MGTVQNMSQGVKRTGTHHSLGQGQSIGLSLKMYQHAPWVCMRRHRDGCSIKLGIQLKLNKKTSQSSS